jgi:hypothetical protein
VIAYHKLFSEKAYSTGNEKWKKRGGKRKVENRK